MAISKYKYDIFVSYAHKERDWVAAFMQKLVSELRNRSDERVSNFISKPRKKILTEKEIEALVYGALDNSAILLLIISSFYVKREWFMREVMEFMKVSGKNGGLIANNSHRIFPVYANKVYFEELPPELKNIQGFYIEQNPTVESILPKPDDDIYYAYFDKLHELVESIYRKLVQMNSFL